MMRSGSRRITRVCTLMVFIMLLGSVVSKEGSHNLLLKQTRETNPVNFIRLLIMRLIYGFATMMGFEEGLSEVANGAFVPPGVDDDYGGFDDRESDYAYSDDDDDY